MFRHQDVADNLEVERVTELREGLHEMAAETLRVKEASPAIGASGKIVEMIEPVMMTLAGHPGILQPRSHTCHTTACMRHPRGIPAGMGVPSVTSGPRGLQRLFPKVGRPAQALLRPKSVTKALAKTAEVLEFKGAVDLGLAGALAFACR